MSEQTGLRARKKARTHDAIADAAISLFLTHGFDPVPDIADVRHPWAPGFVRLGKAMHQQRRRRALPRIGEVVDAPIELVAVGEGVEAFGGW